MASDDTYIPFSQRAGYAPTPTQLKLGEVSGEMRRLLDYCIDIEIRRATNQGYSSGLAGGWRRVAQDLHVRFFKQQASTFENSAYKVRAALERSIQRENIGKLFDLVEFLVRHPGCSNELKGDLADAFITARAAYRIIDVEVVAIGTEEQGAAFEAAIAAVEAEGAGAARKHLIAAGTELRDGNWSGSVRESIHAVEAIALRLVPGTTTLGPALSKLEKEGYLHGGLKAAFSSLYGYTSDEEGVRHALVFMKEARVDEADALFMLGVCASFVSYLIVRDSQSASKS